uniref:RIIa domain-containing protein 1-like n=2 Tax=Neolamprologus brichardi TaxID=32507 RepID=A0A3Q4GDQ6_NEOBR
MAETGGVTKLDVSVLNAEQQEKLRQFKIKTRIDNERYLRSHPEVDVLIGDFLRSVQVHINITKIHAEWGKMFVMFYC